MQVVRALKTEPQAEFHHHITWALTLISGTNILASVLCLTAWLGSISALHILTIEQTETQDVPPECEEKLYSEDG